MEAYDIIWYMITEIDEEVKKIKEENFGICPKCDRFDELLVLRSELKKLSIKSTNGELK